MHPIHEEEAGAAMQMILSALAALRVPLQQGEYDMHRLVMQALEAAGLPAAHEVMLAPRCRIDLMFGGIGIEIKRGRPESAWIRAQLTRYAACEQVKGLILVTERTVALPRSLCGKPVRVVCLNRLWGIAL